MSRPTAILSFAILLAIGGLSAFGAEAARYVRIGHYQCVCRQGDFQANLDTLLKGLELAAEARPDIVSFPESFLTGYFSGEEAARANALTIDSPQIKELLRKTADFEPVFMVGFNELRGDDLYNTVAVIERGKVLGRYAKAMPIHRYFVPGRDFPVFEKKGLTFGVVICADGGYIEPTRICCWQAVRSMPTAWMPLRKRCRRPPYFRPMRGTFPLKMNTMSSAHLTSWNTLTTTRPYCAKCIAPASPVAGS